jgi:hypothetical protein
MDEANVTLDRNQRRKQSVPRLPESTTWHGIMIQILKTVTSRQMQTRVNVLWMEETRNILKVLISIYFPHLHMFPSSGITLHRDIIIEKGKKKKNIKNMTI